MAQKPILFNEQMVRAIERGQKTQTRRLIKPHYHGDEYGFQVNTYPGRNGMRDVVYIDDEERQLDRHVKPPYEIGDELYVRETWQKLLGRYIYRASDDYDLSLYDGKGMFHWKPSIHMPKEAARIWLKITGIGVQKLQEITEKDIRAEGAVDSCCMCSKNRGYDEYIIDCGEGIEKAIDCKLEMMFPNTGFMGLWNSTIPEDKLDQYGWDANPWVWVFHFERIGGPTKP